MPKLTDTQASLLKVAAGCVDRAIRWPATLRGGARTKIITALVAAGLAENRSGSLVITDAGFAAVGLKSPAGATERAKAKTAKRSATRRKDAQRTPAGGRARKTAEKAARKPRTDTKQARMIAMLRSAQGATVDEMAAELGWQHHTVRGAMAGALKRKLGLDITSEKVSGRGRVYRLHPEG